ncbi:hypothetical protein ACQJBY_032330 [Aegilops geniculata]
MEEMMPLLYFLRLGPSYYWFYVCGPAERKRQFRASSGVGPFVINLRCSLWCAQLCRCHLLLQVRRRPHQQLGLLHLASSSVYMHLGLVVVQLVVSSIQKEFTEESFIIQFSLLGVNSSIHCQKCENVQIWLAFKLLNYCIKMAIIA